MSEPNHLSAAEVFGPLPPNAPVSVRDQLEAQ